MWNKIEELIQLSQQSIPNEVEIDRNPERRNYYRFLYHLLKWRKPRVALEIGVELGLASTYMAMAAKEYNGWVIGLDINNLSFKPKENYYFINGDSTQLTTWGKVHKFVEEHGKIGVVYQDSSHHYEASQKEWELYHQLLDRDAIWICDDVTAAFHDPLIDPPGMGMVQYFEERKGDKRLYPNVLHYGNTQGIILINHENFTRPY